MRNNCLVIGGLLIIIFNVQAQKPVALQALALFQGKNPTVYSLFRDAALTKGDFDDFVRESYSMQLRHEIFQQIQQDASGLLRLRLPAPFNVDLDLYRVNIFNQTAQVTSSTGSSSSPDEDHLFYRGIISGNANSLAIVSILDDHIQILFSDEDGNTRIQRMQDGSYVAFSEKDILLTKQLECYTEEDVDGNYETNSGTQRSMTGNCLEVYVEADYQSYLDNGSSVSNTEAWVSSLWNEVITLYDNEDIPVVVSDILIYTTPDPFAGLNSTPVVLNAFSAHIDTLDYDGRLAHFLSTRPLGGGIAWIDVLCSMVNPCAVSASLTTSIAEFPVYSWNVEVVTHEMGHNMGSPHTHACAWNGNNTQIDDCGNQWAFNNNNTPEGAVCYNPSTPILPANGGTIMSYCHLINGIGINFNLGFGTQPGNLIRSKYNNASCNTGTCSAPFCTSLTSPAPSSINVDINANLVWNAAAGANGYKLSIGTILNGTDILDNVDVGLVTTYDPVNAFPFNKTIFVKIVPYNELGNSPGCVYQSFTTELNLPPVCTAMTLPPPGSNNIPLTAIVQWSHAVGNQTGYKITIGTTQDGNQIADNVDVGNVTYYNPPGFLPPGSTIYVTVTPYNLLGDVPFCATQSFSTVVPINGDFCFMAIPIDCGQSLTGSTSLAYDDPEAEDCFTTIEAPGVWYTFIGDGLNTVFSTCSQYGYDIKLNAYSGTCANLVCVAGNDDYCNTGSLISFPTTAGTNYYIFVQGWNGQTGSYTLTRTCYSGPFYCPSQGNNANIEWIKTFSVGTFTKQSGSSSYSDFTSEIITVSRGGIHPVTITPNWLQSARNEYFRIWIDFNADGDFSDAGEKVFEAGPLLVAATGNITIPLGAITGTTRLRVSMRYNQIPGYCGPFTFGEVEDYSVNIRCNLVTSENDLGNGSLRIVSQCVNDGEAVLFAPALNGQTINVTLGPIVADGIWKWMANAGTNIKIKATGINRILSVPADKSVEIQNLELIGGTASVGSAIDNEGDLLLRNAIVCRAVGSSSIPLRNQGSLIIEGACQVMP